MSCEGEQMRFGARMEQGYRWEGSDGRLLSLVQTKIFDGTETT